MTAPEEPQELQDLEGSEESVVETETDESASAEEQVTEVEVAQVKPPPPGIDILIKQDPNGMVDSQLLINLKPSEELLAEVAAQNLRNPHYIVAVTSVSEMDRYGNGPSDYHRQTSAYVVPFNRPFPYVRFKRPGHNRISVSVVNINSRDKEKWADSVRDNNRTLVDNDGSLPEDSYYWHYDAHYGLGSRDVIVPKETFSEPAQWKLNLVRQFWRNAGIDDCKLRGRLLGALPMAFFIQLYGLVIRPLLFALALIMLKRDISLKQFFGTFWPHQGWKATDDSWWFYDKTGKERRNIIPLFSPPALAILSGVFIGIPAASYALTDTSSRGSFWHTVLIWDLWSLGIIAVVAVVIIGLFWLSITWRDSKVVPKSETEEEYLARLRNNLVVVDTPDWENLPENQRTVYLRFAKIKAKVCRPILQ